MEYHLETLTNRSQETDFQIFAKHLAEREICPNLLPQTGPTGGGDSKVDTETYPVADQLSLVWYVGIGREAAAERWAFAISAKKKWRDKVRSDIEKIAATNRGYTTAFFITNQFVPDRTRAEVEDDLRQAYRLDVRILDRTWILDRVFAGHHESLAIDDLRISTSLRSQVRKGPLDIEREQDLTEVQARIESAVQQSQFGLQFVDDCLQAAILARGLDRPRSETDGLFIRADRVAVQYGNAHQQLVSAYEYAWTAYWWYEDFLLTSQQYGIVEARAKGSTNSYELELLSNLWNILFTMVVTGQLDTATTAFDARTETLAAELQMLSQDLSRPSSALQARSLRLLMQLMMSGVDEADRVLGEMRDVVLQSAGLIGFPLEQLAEVLTEAGARISDNSGYNELLDTVIEVVSKRKGDVEAARLLTRRGAQYLDLDRPVDAIRIVGRALANLYTHETRHEFVHALELCGAAYERVGLLWAARGSVLTAASVATREFWTYADVTRHQAACYRRLKWLELQLGRVPQVLAWHDVDQNVRSILAQQGNNPDRLRRYEADFDGILGILLLRTDLWELKWMSFLPDVLEGLDLYNSAIALRYALGHEQGLPKEFLDAVGGDSDLLGVFVRWRDQPAGKELPPRPLLGNTRNVQYASTLLGCRISTQCENDLVCILLTESILAALESLLATGVVDRVAARDPSLTIHIRKCVTSVPLFSFDVVDRDGGPHVEIRCGDFDPNSMPRKRQAEIRTQITELLARILGRAFMFANSEEGVTKLFGDDRALERAVAFTSSFVTLGNVLGHAPSTSISEWQAPTAQDYAPRRAIAWDHAAPPPDPRDELADTPSARLGSAEDIIDVIQSGRVKHTEMETVSLIREELWTEAGWVANAFIWSEEDRQPPILAPVFKNADAAAQIFATWRSRLGESDDNDRLRVTIVRGISVANPHWYRIVFGSNPERRRDIRLMVMVSRVHTMEASTDFNLQSFLNSYQAVGHYLLAHCVLQQGAPQPELIVQDAIRKCHLQVRAAWEVGKHDLDVAGILPDDSPIIPSDQPDAPVLELLRRKQERRRLSPNLE